MKSFSILLLLSSAALAQPPLPVVRSTDYHPNPNFHPTYKRDFPGPGAVEQEGEIVILEGDDDLVSTDANGFGVVFDNRGQNPPLITSRFYEKYGDDFDEIIIFTSFDDQGAAGALAYEISAQQDVKGLGMPLFNETSGWGSNGKLYAFVNMMRWDQFDFPTLPMTDPRSQLYNTLGQEFAHRWLAFMTYKDASGADSMGLLGRDMAHWASTLSADGSLIDGNRLIANPDGTFTTADLMTRYWSLDLYAMGLGPASDVQPFYLLHDAVTSRGRKVDPTQYLADHSVLTAASRENITVEQVIASVGPRVPSFDQAPHDFRLAFALLTAPGERASDVLDAAHTLDQVRKVWEQQFAVFAGGHGRVCTQVSAPCDTAAARVRNGSITEAGGNKNGVAEPGEPVSIRFDLYNDTMLDADHVQLTATGALLPAAGATQQLDKLAAAATHQVTFDGTIPAGAPCGTPITIEVQSVVGDYTYRGFASVEPGVTAALRDTFEDGRSGFVANPGGLDTTVYNGWQYGAPVSYRGMQGWLFQPTGCHDSSKKCWFTGLQKGTRGTNKSTLGVGRSTLLSPAINLGGAYQPSLRYFAWWQAIDFSNPQMGGVPDTTVALVVEGSTDGGNTWVTLDTLSDSEPKWVQRDVALDPKMIDLKSGQLILRFTASNPIATDMVEAGIDDVEVLAESEACNPDAVPPAAPRAHHGCDLGGGRATTGAPLLFAAVLLLALRRRARVR